MRLGVVKPTRSRKVLIRLFAVNGRARKLSGLLSNLAVQPTETADRLLLEFLGAHQGPHAELPTRWCAALHKEAAPSAIEENSDPIGAAGQGRLSQKPGNGSGGGGSGTRIHTLVAEERLLSP